jgi:hypothetical protein
VRLGIALILVVMLVAGIPRLFDPQTWMLAHALHDLGPISGWRCASSSTYTYDPNRERPDSTLLADAPEAHVLEAVPWMEIDRVEANLRGGDTLVSVHTSVGDTAQERRVYVLSPGQVQTVWANDATVCNVHLSDWQIVGEEELG